MTNEINASVIGIIEGDTYKHRETGETVTIKSVHRYAVRVKESAYRITAVNFNFWYVRA